MQDAITVLPAAAILLPGLAAGSLRTFIRLALLPFPYYVLFLGPPASFLVPVLLGGIVVTGALARWSAPGEGPVPLPAIVQESA